ncbi:MAG: tRNA (N6-isopentenyl adenosine(37)-C2)-methylthiotransferase MiaB [Pseudomonadota bacterium]
MPTLLDKVNEQHETDAMAGGKKVFVKTFGCQMNVYDSERMAGALEPYGYAETDSQDEADLIVLNTCHIREKAAEKVYSELGRVRKTKAERRARGKDTAVAVAGCVAQAEGEEILRRAPTVDLVIGPQNYHRLPELIFRAKSEARQMVATDFPEDDKFKHLPARTVPKAASAFLTVQEGCDKFCTFCVVPYTRGVEYSRPVAALVEEAQRLVDGGVREITLLGQNVNAYHGENAKGRSATLAELIDSLAAIPDLERLRYTTSHPRDMSADLIAAHRDQPKLMPYLHLPFQAGSDRILAAMNRKHTAAEYLDIIAAIRKARPDMALSTDIIVGFPGETDAEFEQTLDVVRQVQFAQAYSFKYSARPGTPAASLDDPLSDAEKSARLHALQAVLDEQQSMFNQACIGRVIPVLFERPGRFDGQLVGRSPYLQPVHAAATDAWLGHIMPVEISSAGPNSLSGTVCAAS